MKFPTVPLCRRDLEEIPSGGYTQLFDLRYEEVKRLGYRDEQGEFCLEDHDKERVFELLGDERRGGVTDLFPVDTGSDSVGKTLKRLSMTNLEPATAQDLLGFQATHTLWNVKVVIPMPYLVDGKEACLVCYSYPGDDGW